MRKLDILGVPNGYDVDGKVWRSGQPSDSAWPLIRKAGAVAVLDLNSELPEPALAQARLAKANDLLYTALDWNGILPPSLKKVETALELLDEWSIKGPVLVHCLQGSDRTGTLCACWRIHHDGWDLDDSIFEAFTSLGFGGMHEFWMAAAVAEYFCHYDRRRKI